MLLIAIDFDNTFTANPEMWRSLIDLGHYSQTARFILVTERNQSHDNAADVVSATSVATTPASFTPGAGVNFTPLKVSAKYAYLTLSWNASRQYWQKGVDLGLNYTITSTSSSFLVS